MLSNAEFLPKMDAYLGHWALVDARLGPGFLTIQLPLERITLTRAQFGTLRDTVAARQGAVQNFLQTEQIKRGIINLQKEELLKQFNLFTAKLDAFFQGTEHYAVRPLAPSVRSGEQAFMNPMGEVLTLWAKINTAVAPPGVELPLVLADGATQGSFASAVSSLAFAYKAEKAAAQETGLARGSRDLQQETAYEAMKSYRLAVESNLAMHPDLVGSLPRLSPLPGHTPARVNVSGVFEAPNKSKVVHDPSEDAMLERYELRGTIGDDYDPDDAVVIGSHGPGAPREFVTTFGLDLPGARVALKLFVILTTGNQAGSAVIVVERPLAQVA